MSDFDIENFPSSETAKRMLSTISEEFYKDSYVMKWLLQVMGIEWDHAVAIIEEELPKQFVPETATWGLRFHEIKWQLPVRENLSYEERRKRIYQKRDFKGPMTPYRLEEYLGKMLGAEVHVMDCHNPGIFGYVAKHPNMFKVIFIKDGTLDAKAVFYELNRMKQSHTVYDTVEDRVIIIVDYREVERVFARRAGIKTSISFWRCHIFDGTDYFDGSLLMDGERQYNLISGVQWYRIKFTVQEVFYLNAMTVYSRIATDESMKVSGDVRAKIEFRNQVDNDGNINIDHFLQIEESDESVGNVTMTRTRNLCFFDGSVCFDGSKIMNSIYQKEVL